MLSNVFEQSEYFNINSISNETSSISNNDDTNEKLTNIAKLIVTKKRVDVDLMENVILKLCRIKPMELKELAKLLNRNDVGLRSNYLNRIVKQNKLKLLYPGQISHPKQAYFTNKENQ